MKAHCECGCRNHGRPEHPPGSVQVEAGCLTTFDNAQPGQMYGVRACWLADPADPLALTLRLRNGDRSWVDWSMARSLVAKAVTEAPSEANARKLSATGTRQQAGAGDVRLELLRDVDGHQERDRLWIELVPPDRRMVLIGEAEDARAALRLAKQAVPDLDAEWLVALAVEALLAEPAP